MAGEAGLVTVGCGVKWFGRRGSAWHREMRLGEVWLGRRGKAWWGVMGRGKAWYGRKGGVRHGPLRLGAVR